MKPLPHQRDKDGLCWLRCKAPRPEFKEEILAYFNWADESEKRFEKQGLPLEAKKMKIAKNRAKHELDEIPLILNYKGDELHSGNMLVALGKSNFVDIVARGN